MPTETSPELDDLRQWIAIVATTPLAERLIGETVDSWATRLVGYAIALRAVAQTAVAT